MARSAVNRLRASIVVFSLALAQSPVPTIEAQSTSAVAGTVSGQSGPLAGVTVQALNAAGSIAGSATTNAVGGFRIENLPPGTYTLRALSSAGSVIATSLVAVPAGGATVAASLTATAAALSGPATAATTGAAGVGAASGMRLTTKIILASIGVAAATVGAAAIITTRDEASGRR
jgi:hypothetical protein